MQRHFQLSPPSVHQMVLTLERLCRPGGAAERARLVIARQHARPLLSQVRPTTLPTRWSSGSSSTAATRQDGPGGKLVEPWDEARDAGAVGFIFGSGMRAQQTLFRASETNTPFPFCPWSRHACAMGLGGIVWNALPPAKSRRHPQGPLDRGRSRAINARKLASVYAPSGTSQSSWREDWECSRIASCNNFWHRATRPARSGRGTEHPAQDHSEDIYDATTTLY